jgi:hypothetical protein
VVLPGVKTSISTDKKLLVCILSFNLTFNNFKNSSDIIFPLLGFNICQPSGEEDEQRANYVKSTILTKPDQLNIAEARPDKEDINQVVEKVKHSKWIVLFLSKNQKWFEVWMAELLIKQTSYLNLFLEDSYNKKEKK